MSNRDMYVEGRMYQASLARLAAQELRIVNSLLDQLEQAHLLSFEGRAEEYRAIDEEARIIEAFDGLNVELRRLNDDRRKGVRVHGM